MASCQANNPPAFRPITSFIHSVTSHDITWEKLVRGVDCRRPPSSSLSRLLCPHPLSPPLLYTPFFTSSWTPVWSITREGLNSLPSTSSESPWGRTHNHRGLGWIIASLSTTFTGVRATTAATGMLDIVFWLMIVLLFSNKNIQKNEIKFGWNITKQLFIQWLFCPYLSAVRHQGGDLTLDWQVGSVL